MKKIFLNIHGEQSEEGKKQQQQQHELSMTFDIFSSKEWGKYKQSFLYLRLSSAHTEREKDPI
jgi:hypothetical protein